MGELDWGEWWDGVSSAFATLLGILAGAATSAVMASVSGVQPIAAIGIGIVVGASTTGIINNTIDAIYYEYSYGDSELSSDTYSAEDKYISKWDRLDYTKSQTEEKHYDLNAWRYMNEYSLHMYGWIATGWAYTQKIPVVSSIAERCKIADVDTKQWDGRFVVDFGTAILGGLGY